MLFILVLSEITYFKKNRLALKLLAQNKVLNCMCRCTLVCNQAFFH